MKKIGSYFYEEQTLFQYLKKLWKRFWRGEYYGN
ncbi:hypothetical protein FUSNEC_GEN_294_01490 [Fusobacterium necrophorum subsp. funduliforme]